MASNSFALRLPPRLGVLADTFIRFAQTRSISNEKTTRRPCYPVHPPSPRLSQLPEPLDPNSQLRIPLYPSSATPSSIPDTTGSSASTGMSVTVYGGTVERSQPQKRRNARSSLYFQRWKCAFASPCSSGYFWHIAGTLSVAGSPQRAALHPPSAIASRGGARTSPSLLPLPNSARTTATGHQTRSRGSLNRYTRPPDFPRRSHLSPSSPWPSHLSRAPSPAQARRG